MKLNHLSEIQIQQYALDKTNCEADLIEHIWSCESCKARTANYRLLFIELKEQPKPVFDFNAADLVLAMLPKSKKAAVRNSHWVYVLVFAAFGSIGTPLYLFREDIRKMLDNTLPAAIYLVVTTALLILVFQGIEIFRKYKRQLNALNY
jgi:hypothetical protein